MAQSPEMTSSVHRLRLLIVTLWIITSSSYSTKCPGGLSFEKVSRSLLQGARQHKMAMPRQSKVALTSACLERCEQLSECQGVHVDYSTRSCFALDDAEERTLPLQPSPDPVNYFHKICLNANLRCNKKWVVERAIGFEIDGYDDIVLRGVTSAQKCAELCLHERGLQCRSAEFESRMKECRLSRQDRRMQPLHYRPASEYVQYIENQCSQAQSKTKCEFEEYKNQDLNHPDLVLEAKSKLECQKFCDEEASFVCRSFTWVEAEQQCMLSGDDMISAGPSAVKEAVGASFFQRSPCIDLELGCSVDAMTVSLKTSEPFQGRVFSQNAPSACDVIGNGRTETTIAFPFQDRGCGVVDEGDGVFSNVIVVQHHPVIQRRGDKAVKILCYFQTDSKVVTTGFNLAESPSFSNGVVTAIVNATAPTPKIRLRIVNSDGRDISGAKLGEQLFLRLELGSSSIYGILARKLIATSGDNSESIVLLDDLGCPADPLIFPSLQPLPGSRILQGRFEAFKFTENDVVRFRVNVQFCLQECTPADCGHVISYGRRRRRRNLDNLLKKIVRKENVTTEVPFFDSVYHEMPLQKEIIVDNTEVIPLKPGHPTEGVALQHLVCTSKEVLIAISVAAAVLQICIILVAIMCVVVRIQRRKPSSDGALPSSRLWPQHSASTENTSTTLRSLRTSLRD